MIIRQGLDIYVDGVSVATGALASSNTAVSLSTRGTHTFTAYPQGVAVSTGIPAYTDISFDPFPTRMIHMVTDAAENNNVS